MHTTIVATRADASFTLARTTARDHDELFASFCAIVARDEGYPQDPQKPLTRAEFDAYWLAPATVGVVARRTEDGTLAGAFTMKPNGVGRAAHVGNAGYFTDPSARGLGLGEALVRHSLEVAREHGFDALQFNFVFESNPARALYERLGFQLVGHVPDVIGTQAVCIYWRKL